MRDHGVENTSDVICYDYPLKIKYYYRVSLSRVIE